MEISLLIVILIIAIFSVIQSLFGVGLLVFGTPPFLLLGVGYADSIGYLLPSSLLLSAVQSHDLRGRIKIARGIVLYAIPFVFFGMALSIGNDKNSFVAMIVGVTMLMLALMRIAGVDKFSNKIVRFSRSSLIVTGFIHGISNQGGALLTVLMGSIYSGDKEKIRTNIAFAYLLFGLSQLALLFWLGTGVIGWNSIIYIVITLVLYQLAGNNLFQSINIELFNLIFTIFMVIYGLLLISTFLYNL